MWVKKGGEKLWQEYVNEETGESSIKEHKLKVIWKSCKDGEHDYQWEDVPKRTVRCQKCQIIKTIIIGLHKLENGKIVPINPPSK